MNYKVILLAGAALAASPAWAQSSQEDGASAEQTGAKEVRDDAYTDGDIIVTATRQDQAISRVPISISAFSQESLDSKGLKSFTDVARFTPGVRVADGNQIAIRGIASTAGSGTTGIYIDDTPIQIRNVGNPDADNSAPAIFDLERVEVLRGPQGTLFGAGSEGGTVRFITPQPSMTDWSTYSRAEIATTEKGAISYEAGVAVGGPLVEDRLGIRLSAFHRRDGGFIDRVDYQSGEVDARDINHGRVTVLRGALAWQPIEGLIITPSLLYQRRTTNAPATFFTGTSDPDGTDYRTGSPSAQQTRDRYYLPTLNIKYDSGTVTFVSNASYFDRRNRSGYDGTLFSLDFYEGCYVNGCGFQEDGIADQSNFPFLTSTGINPALPRYASAGIVTNRQKMWTQEFRVQSSDPGSRFSWVAGVFYQDTKQGSTEALDESQGNAFFDAVFGQSYEDFFFYPLYQGRFGYIGQIEATEEQLAGFADVTYEIVPTVKLTAGARVTKVKATFESLSDGPLVNFELLDSGRSKETAFTPKLGVNWQVDPRNLVYATWAKGFRPGGPNGQIPYSLCQADFDELGLTESPLSYESDRVRSVEVGTKNKLFGNRVQIAASAFDIKWSNIQQPVSLSTCGTSFTGNTGTARSRGFDLQFSATPFDGFSVDGSVGYNDAYYTTTVQLGSGKPTRVEGNAIGVSPWSLALGAQYDFSAGGADLYIRGDLSYQSALNRRTPSLDPRAQSYDADLLRDEARTQVSARAGVELDDLNISLFVENLTNENPRIGYGHQGRGSPLFTETALRPRTFGVTVSYSH